MIKRNRLSVGEDAVAEIAGYVPVSQIPRADVVNGVTKDAIVRKIGGNEVGPPLVCEEAARDIVVAEVIQAITPPRCKPPAFFGVVNAEKAQIVDSVLEDGELVVNDRDASLFGLADVGG